MPFEKATYNIWDIPLTKFEECVKRFQIHGWMKMLELYFRQRIIRKGEMKMAGLTQEQQSNSQFTLESILEEDDQEEVVEEKKKIHKNNEVSKSLPFDKCIEADNEVDELEKRKTLCRQLGDKLTTKKESKRAIRKWLGIGTIIKTIFKVAFKPILVHAISIAGVIFFSKLLISSFNINSFDLKDYFLSSLLMFVSGMMILVLVAVAIGALVWAAMDDYNFIEEKMKSKDYMLDENIIDCPIAAKEELLSCIKDDDELYIRLNKKKNRIDALDEKSNFSSSWKFEKPKGKHDIEFQMKYFADQLEDGKIYKISDIITDKAHKKQERNEEK